MGRLVECSEHAPIRRGPDRRHLRLFAAKGAEGAVCVCPLYAAMRNSLSAFRERGAATTSTTRPAEFDTNDFVWAWRVIDTASVPAVISWV